MPSQFGMNPSGGDSNDQDSYRKSENIKSFYHKSDSWESSKKRMSDKKKKGFPMNFKNNNSSFDSKD